MTETTSKGQTAYERWEMASFGDSETDRRVRKDDVVVQAKANELYEASSKAGYSKGYTKGMQDGFAVGLENAKAKSEADSETIKAIAGQFQEALITSDEKIADDVLSLALDIAQAMVKRHLETDEKMILPIITDAMHYLPHVEKPARLLVNPEDVTVIREHLGEALASDGWVIQEESSIEKGGCKVETGANQIDATNKIRWQRVSEAFSKQVNWVR